MLSVGSTTVLANNVGDVRFLEEQGRVHGLRSDRGSLSSGRGGQVISGTDPPALGEGQLEQLEYLGPLSFPTAAPWCVEK